MKQVAIVGTQGVPAQYGGFESLVENIIGDNCSAGIEYTIFCSGTDMPDKRSSYKGCRLKYINLSANGISSIPYDIISMILCIRGYDTILILGTSGCVFIPILRLLSKSRIVVNIDGLEHKRDKWGKFAKWFLKLSEAFAVRNADVVIADNKGIQDYVREIYRKEAVMIAYGGNHVLRDISEQEQHGILSKYKLTSNQYAITICRIEPENNSHIILKAFAETKKQLVFVGNWNRSEYSKGLKEQFRCYDNIVLIDSLYNLDELYALRNNCALYIHGHSAGGTNPSLVEAMFFGKPILAYDVVYNRETTDRKAQYFKDLSGLKELIDIGAQLAESGNDLKKIAQKRYLWKKIIAVR